MARHSCAETIRRVGWIWLVVLTIGGLAQAHPMPYSAVVLRLDRVGVSVELTLPLAELAMGWDKPLPPDAAATVRQFGSELSDYVRSHVHATTPDGRSWTVTVGVVIPIDEPNPEVRVDLRLTPPPDAPVDRLTFHYDLILHHLITHMAIVTLASDWRNGVLGEEPVVLGTMRDSATDLVIDRSMGSWLRGCGAMFRLGTRHIAEGTDHLLFLLALLLPAPLVATGGRWGGYAGARATLRCVVGVVTAFTLGHSLTLVLGALGWVRLPGALVESAIAISILVSAIHALIPIFSGREVVIAGGFGLVHGLAFAATLTGFGLDRWTLISSVLGFNLGVEAFQLLVVLLVLPWIILLAHTRAAGSCRVAGALLIALAAVGWFVERALGWVNPLALLVDQVAAFVKNR